MHQEQSCQRKEPALQIFLPISRWKRPNQLLNDKRSSANSNGDKINMMMRLVFVYCRQTGYRSEHIVMQHKGTLAPKKPRTLLETRRHAPQLSLEVDFE